MNDTKIKNKILNGQKLTEEEVQYVAWEWRAEESFESGEHHRWWVPITLIYKINNKYYSIWYEGGLTECQEDEYPEQVAIQVEKKPVTTYEWVKVKKDAI